MTLMLALLLSSAAIAKDMDPESAEFLDRCRYIITKMERQMFESLPTVERRHEFIDNFWRGWDPNPVTAANEYRDLYYQRIDEANRRYTRGQEGYLTDRGKVYILMGDPDEKETAYSGRTSDEKPSETWIYRSASRPGMLRDTEITFIDETGTGNYRIASRAELDAGAARAGIFHSLQGDITAHRTAAGLQTNPRDLYERSPTGTLVAQAPEGGTNVDAAAAAAGDFKIPVTARLDYVKASMGKTLVVLTVSLDRAVASGTVADYKVYCRVEPPAGAAAATPAADPAATPAAAPSPLVVDSMEGRETKGSLLYQAQLPVDPGSHRVIYGVTDVALNLPKTFEMKAEVPAYADDAFALSTIVPATLVEAAPAPAPPAPAADGSVPAPAPEDMGPKLVPFQLSGMTVLPAVDGKFEKSATLFVYSQVYGAGATPKVDVDYLISMKQADGKWKAVGKMPNPGQTQMVLEYELELKLLPGPGDYKVEVTAKDTVAKKQAKGEALFSVK